MSKSVFQIVLPLVITAPGRIGYGRIPAPGGVITDVDISYPSDSPQVNVGSSLIDVHLNGSSIFTLEADRPEIAQGETEANTTGLEVVTIKGDDLEIFLDGVPTGGTDPLLAVVVTIETGEGSEIITSGEGDLFLSDDGTYKEVTGGGGGGTLASVLHTTPSLANNATENADIALGKTFSLIRVTADRACRVRLYSTSAYRAADSGRSIGTDPTGEHGVICDLVFTVSNLTLDLAPVVLGSNLEAVRSANIPGVIENRSGSPAAVAVTFSAVALEQ